MDRLDDDELLALTPRRPEAFAVFYRRHEQALLGWLVRRTGDPELAADLSAETWAAALLGVRL
jgi:RNA polymerase sigma-70 factor (ECF subfamily)